MMENVDQGYLGLRLGTGAGALKLQGPFGAPVVYQIEDGSGITGWSVSWSIAGTAGGGVFDLENGGMYGPPWGRTSNALAPGLTGPLVRNGEALCELNVSPTWFTIVSETPDTCEVYDMTNASFLISGTPVGHSIALRSDGLCRARLEAPRFNGGQGATSSMGVTVTDVDGLISF